jgi:hypothetical protein
MLREWVSLRPNNRAPGYYQVDSSLFKDFHITEGQKIGFRLDAFNVLNVADYGNPDNNIQDYNPDPTQSSYGKISSVRNQERRFTTDAQLQLLIKSCNIGRREAGHLFCLSL